MFTHIEVQHFMYLNCTSIFTLVNMFIIEVQHFMYLNGEKWKEWSEKYKIEVQHFMYLNNWKKRSNRLLLD